MFKKLLKTNLTLILFGALTFSSLWAKENGQVNSIELNTTKGESITIKINSEGFVFDKYKGKAVLLDFFGPMCPPCIYEIPHLIKMQKEYKDKFQIVGVQVQMQMSNKELEEFMKEKGINYPVVNLDYAWDLIAFIKANTGWGGQIPYMLIFDKEGKLRKQFIGMTPNEAILKYVK